jgi:hypothetical protein
VLLALRKEDPDTLFFDRVELPFPDRMLERLRRYEG